MEVLWVAIRYPKKGLQWEYRTSLTMVGCKKGVFYLTYCCGLVKRFGYCVYTVFSGTGKRYQSGFWG